MTTALHQRIIALLRERAAAFQPGIDAEFGPTDPNPLEIEVKRAWAAVSARVVLLSDSRKFGEAAVMIHPRRLHALVTDATPPPEIVARLAEHGVEVVIAE